MDEAAPLDKPGTNNVLQALVRVCRPNQWTKNLIVFVPILFAGKIGDAGLLLKVALFFVALCLISSAIYVFNDLLDRDADRLHPEKRLRPIASGALGTRQAVILFAVLAVAGVALAFLVRPSLIMVAAAYLGIMVLYSLWWKHLALIDVFCIAAGFVLRAVGGAGAAFVPVSAWLLLCVSFAALFLALEKRRKEMVIMSQHAIRYRKALSGYSAELLTRMEALILPSLLTCYAIYSFQSPHGIGMLITVPIVVFGLMRYQMLSATSMQTASPEKVLLQDRPLQAAILLWVFVCAAVIYNVLWPTAKFARDFLDSLSF